MTFYTYMWLREDGTPYYVGKGTGQRAFRKGCPPHERIVVQDWPSEEDALHAERFLISFYGRKDKETGCLINLTDGGDGTSGYKHAGITFEHQSKAGRMGGLHKKTEATKNKLREAATRQFESASARKALWPAQRKRETSEKQKQAVAAANRLRKGEKRCRRVQK